MPGMSISEVPSAASDAICRRCPDDCPRRTVRPLSSCVKQGRHELVVLEVVSPAPPFAGDLHSPRDACLRRPCRRGMPTNSTDLISPRARAGSTATPVQHESHG
jgi:hypothetical protein